MNEVTLILKTWLGLTVALSLSSAYKIDDQCAWDLYYCDYPYDIQETFHFRCKSHDDCPTSFVCCNHRCFRHKICQPVRNTAYTPMESTGMSRTKPEECDVIVSCDVPLPAAFTRAFECHQDDDCPDHHNCCFVECYNHKVCQPARSKPKMSSTKSEALTKDIGTTTKMSDSKSSSKSSTMTSEKSQKPSVTETSISEDSEETITVIVETTPITSRPTGQPPVEIKDKPVPTPATDTTISKHSEETITVTPETIPRLTEEPPIEIKEKPVPTSATEATSSKSSKETTTEVVIPEMTVPNETPEQPAVRTTIKTTAAKTTSAESTKKPIVSPTTLKTEKFSTDSAATRILETTTRKTEIPTEFPLLTTELQTPSTDSIIKITNSKPPESIIVTTKPDDFKTGEEKVTKTSEDERKVEEQSTINTIHQTENKELIKTTVRITEVIEEDDERQAFRGYSTMTTPIGSLRTQGTSTSTTTSRKGLTEAITNNTIHSHSLVESPEVAPEIVDLESSGDSEITGDDEDEENEKNTTVSTLEEAKNSRYSPEATVRTTQTQSQRLGESTKSNNESDDLEASGDLEIVGDDEDEWIRIRGFTTTTVLAELIRNTNVTTNQTTSGRDSTTTTIETTYPSPLGKTTKRYTEIDDFEASGDLEIIGDDEDERKEEENNVATFATPKIINGTSTPLHQTTNGEGSAKTNTVKDEQLESSGFDASGDMETMRDDEE